VRDALEAIYARTALEEHARRDRQPVVHDLEPRATMKADDEAKNIADTPHYIEGWDEWNEVERSETDPSKPPLKVRT
jgi:hypothetical protein